MLRIITDSSAEFSEDEAKALGQRRALKALADCYNADEIDPMYPIYFLQSDKEAGIVYVVKK